MTLKSKEQNSQISQIEHLQLAVSSAMITDNGILAENSLKDAIKNELGINDDIDLIKKSDGWKFTFDKETYIIQNNGLVYVYGDLENLKAGDYIKYDSKMADIGDNGVIICKVLYDTDYNISNSTNYGIQIVSLDSLEDVTLGYNDSSITDLTDIPQIAGSNLSNYINFNKAAYSYNNAISILNSIAQKYLNKNIAYSARCVSSDPLDSGVKTTENINRIDVSLEFEPSVDVTQFKISWYDLTDIEQMGLLNIVSSNVNYWVPHRYYIYDSTRIMLGMMYTDVSTNKFNYSHICYVSKNGADPYAPSYGFRAVFTLKSSVKIIDGDGTADNPYILN